MRLYPKKLHSIDDLERERKLVLKQREQLEQGEFLSVEGLLGNIGKGAKDARGAGGSVFDMLSFLPISNPLFDTAIKLAQGWFANRSDRKAPVTKENKKKKKGKNPIASIAMEVIGGYLKWKAVELSIKGVKHIINTRREHKEQK
jgi:hypothetical protein